MSLNTKTNSWLKAVLIAAMIAPPIVIVALLSWLKQMPETFVFAITGVAGAMTVLASYALSVIHDKNIDEWDRTNARFSSQWGWTAGASLVALLLNLSAFRDWVVAVITKFTKIAVPEPTVIITTFTFGFVTLVIAQLLCTAILSMAWAFWKSRPARNSL